MRLTLLGTGDATGTPKIGCICPQCDRARRTGEARLRTSLLIENEGKHLLIDSSPDLRLQMLLNNSPHIDAVIWTHGHYDHFIGFGEFYRVQKMPPVYATPQVLDYCCAFFTFLPFAKRPVEPFASFDLLGLTITFIPVNHPPTPTFGLIIEKNRSRIGYTSDTNREIPQKTRTLLDQPDLLLLDALVPSGVHINKHMNYKDACDLAKSLGSAEFRCVHMSHMIPWDLPCIGTDGETFSF
jgi:phosphoribosyl 1,2-cyclic phosphate phosphodiesterase